MVLFINDTKVDSQGEEHERTHDTLIKRHKHNPFHIRGIAMNESNAVCYESDDDEENEYSDFSDCDSDIIE